MGRSHHPDPRVWAAVVAAQAEGRITRDTGVNAEFVAAAATGLTVKIPVPSALPDGIDEAEFQSQTRLLFRGLGWDFYHTHDSRRSDEGFIDCVAFLTPAVFVERRLAAELKVGKNKPTEAQRKWLAHFAAAGFMTFVWYPEDWPEMVRVARCSLLEPPAASPRPSATPTPSTRRSSGRRPK